MRIIKASTGGGGSFDPASPGPIGGTTPSTGAFTSVAGGSEVAVANTGAFKWTGRGQLAAAGQNGALQLSNSTATQSFTLCAPAINATPVFQIGNFDTAAPVAQIIRAQGARSGTDTNTAPPDLKIQAGNATGNAAGAAIVFQTPVPTSSGTGAQTQTTGLTVKRGVAILPAYAVTSLPAAADVPYGRCFVTDATAPTFGSTVAGGGSVKTPVWSDGTNWIVG